MSNYRRPWWLLVSRPVGLVTTIQDESEPGQRRFIIRGEPVVQGLTWLTCGPVSALLAIALLTASAIYLDARDQGNLFRVLFIAAFLGLPALVWGLSIFFANKLSAKHLKSIRQSESRECIITLSHREGKLSYKSSTSSQSYEIPYERIQQVHVTPAIGAQDGTDVYLSLETDEGTIVLLSEMLGTHGQKADLALELETAIKNYLRIKNPSQTYETP